MSQKQAPKMADISNMMSLEKGETKRTMNIRLQEPSSHTNRRRRRHLIPASGMEYEQVTPLSLGEIPGIGWDDEQSGIFL